MSYDGSVPDAWLTTDRGEEEFQKAHEAFQKSDAYLDAYTDHCDSFDSSPAYDRSFERWYASLDEDRDVDVSDDGYDASYFDDEVGGWNVAYIGDFDDEQIKYYGD